MDSGDSVGAFAVVQPGATLLHRNGLVQAVLPASDWKVQPRYRQAKATKRGGMEDEESESTDSTVEVGELGREDPPEGSGASNDKPAGRTRGGGSELRSRVNVTPADSNPDSRRVIVCEAKLSFEEPDAVVLHV